MSKKNKHIGLILGWAGLHAIGGIIGGFIGAMVVTSLVARGFPTMGARK
jgi:hypothetical protein